MNLRALAVAAVALAGCAGGGSSETARDAGPPPVDADKLPCAARFGFTYLVQLATQAPDACGRGTPDSFEDTGAEWTSGFGGFEGDPCSQDVTVSADHCTSEVVLTCINDLATKKVDTRIAWSQDGRTGNGTQSYSFVAGGQPCATVSSISYSAVRGSSDPETRDAVILGGM